MAKDNGLIGRLVAGAGGGALVGSVFRTWYSLNLADVLRAIGSQLPAQFSGSLSDVLAQAGGLTLTWSGWHAVHTIRFVLLLVGVAVLVSSMVPSTAPGNGRALVVLAGGLLVALLAVYRIESPPGALDISLGGLQFPSPAGTGTALSRFLHVHAGSWTALFGSALVVLGGWSQLGSGQTVLAMPVPALPIGSASKAPPGRRPS
jgi:hypothetical protein